MLPSVSRTKPDARREKLGLITPSNSHHHHTHLHHRKDHSREKEAQSAHPNLQPNELGSRSEGVTPEESRAGSRRTSVHGDMMGWEGNGREREKRVVKEGEVKEERERGVLRAT